ncbi:MAG: WD40 repeat domain-containing protein [Leptolyngbyaceae cyanobacterium bins.349]|nr:WD40 repeat domain-containing protein [Leptolyngbyaceae cyanobacterium bins.349]
MGQKRFLQILVVVMAVSLLSGLIWGIHHTIKRAIAAQTHTQILCLPSFSQPSLCYPAETQLSTQPTTAIATTPRDKWLVSSNKNQIDVWDLTTGQQVRSLQGHSQWVTALAISPNGNTLASGSLDGTINLWDLATGTLQATLFARHVTVLAFSPDGSTLASGNRLITATAPKIFHPLQLWDVGQGQLLANLTVEEPITAIAFSPDGQRLAAGTAATKVWDLPTQAYLYTVASGDLNTLTFSADGQLLLTGSDGIQGEDGIKMWDARTGKLARVLDSVAADFALSPDGSVLITTYGGNANFWQMQPFQFLGTLRGSTYSGLTAKFGLSGRAIAMGSSDGVKVWYSQPLQRNN